MRDIWAGGAELDRVAGSNDTLARTLLEHQCDFDMIDDDLLEDEATTARDGCLQAGPMRYDAVYVSRTRHMSDGSREKLARFIGAGGRVYWVDNRDASEAPAGSTSIELDELDARQVDPLVEVRPANAGVRVCRRDLENGTLYFLTNEDTGVGKEEAVPAGATIVFKDDRPVIRIDPETGTCSTPEDATHADGTCSVALRMRFAESYVFLFTDDDIPAEPACSPHPEKRIPIDEGWTCRRTRAFRIGDQEFEVQDVHEDASPIALGDWSDALGHDFTGDAEYGVAFDLSGPENGARVHARPGPGVGRGGGRPERRPPGAAGLGAVPPRSVWRGEGGHEHAERDRHQHDGQPVPAHQEARPLAGQRPGHLPQAVPGPGARLHQKRALRPRECQPDMMPFEESVG
ncbi:MAG: hypothetical protein OXQ31_08970 [Spirochaetaceae bacterium]|nr:hypothetical protein [Spirochaetaceae bacterium]